MRLCFLPCTTPCMTFHKTPYTTNLAIFKFEKKKSNKDILLHILFEKNKQKKKLKLCVTGVQNVSDGKKCNQKQSTKGFLS